MTEKIGVDTDIFRANEELLAEAVRYVADPPAVDPQPLTELPPTLPRNGIGAESALELVARIALPRTTSLRDPLAAARMGSPTPWITWAASIWSAARSENLLHQATTPQVNELQDLVVSWLAPMWGMTTGHLVPGATVANLTALWAARDGAGATRILTSDASHASLVKVSRLLSMPLVRLDCDRDDRLIVDALVDCGRRDPEGFSRSVVVLTAGTHNTGSIDPLLDAVRGVRNAGLNAAWWHVDASWAGPLALSARHRSQLAGVEKADSVTVAAHKLMYQPTESALVLFASEDGANNVLEFDGPDHTRQIGLLGSRADRALSIALTFLAYGADGVASWLDAGIAAMSEIAEQLAARPDVEVFAPPTTGILLWRPTRRNVDDVCDALGPLIAGLGVADGRRWIRQVAANPILDPDELLARIVAVLEAPAH